MAIYSYTRLDGERVWIDTGVDPLLVDVTDWFEDGKSNCPICGHYGFLDDCDCHANAVDGKIYIATFGLYPQPEGGTNEGE